jgi:hypothetical protein
MRLLLIAAAIWAALPVSAATLKEASGLVQLRRAGEEQWVPAKPGYLLREGDALRTGFNARALLLTKQGSGLALAGNAHVVMDDDGPSRLTVYLLFGAAKVDASIAGGKQAAVRTPVATLRPRSDRATFTAVVGGGGKTVVDVSDGLVGVEDNRGASALLKHGDRLAADMRGLAETESTPTPAKARKQDFAALMRRELSFELAADESLERAAVESRRAEHELGRLLTDAGGNRVRVESYVTRPAADTVKLVVLNGRSSGLDAFAWTGTFDAALPADLAPVFDDLGGRFDAAASFTLLEYRALFTNGHDRLEERADGGHQVDLNANADPLDDVAGGRPFFYTFFDREGVYVDGALKRGWTGAALQQQSDAVASTTNDPFTGAALPAALPAVAINTTAPDGGRQFRRVDESYGDGSELVRDDRALLPEGGTARAPGSYADHEMQATVRASEWSGRSIEIVASPRILQLTRQVP